MKKSVIIAFLSFLVLLTASCSNRVLIVSIVEESGQGTAPSQKAFIEKSLIQGGQIKINVETARKIDLNFDNKYAVSDSEDNFLVRPALLNFITSRGWEFRQVTTDYSGETCHRFRRMPATLL